MVMNGGARGPLMGLVREELMNLEMIERMNSWETILRYPKEKFDFVSIIEVVDFVACLFGQTKMVTSSAFSINGPIRIVVKSSRNPVATCNNIN